MVGAIAALVEGSSVDAAGRAICTARVWAWAGLPRWLVYWRPAITDVGRRMLVLGWPARPRLHWWIRLGASEANEQEGT